MIIFCEECGARNYLESALIKSSADNFRCRICGDLIPLPTTDQGGVETDAVRLPEHKILIVDDVPNNLLIMEKILDEHCSIILASDGHKALELAHAEEPDLILLDIIMPGMSGYEVCKALKKSKKTRHIPVIFVTSKDDAVDEEKGLKLGAIDYITKPFKFSIIKARVAVHLELKRHQDNLKKHAYKLSVSNKKLKDQIVKHEQIDKNGRRYHDQWLSAFNALDEIVTIQDSTRKILQANHAACQALNADPDQLIGKHCYEVFHGGEKTCKGCPPIEMFANASVNPFEIHHPKINRTFLVSNTPIYDNEGQWVGWAHTAKDASEKSTVDSQMAYISQLELLGVETINVLNHFRKVFGQILTNSQKIREKNEKRKSISENIYKIGEAIRHGGKIINGLEKRVHEIRSQEYLQVNATDLTKVLETLRRSIQKELEGNIEIAFNGPKSLPIRGDKDTLRQIFEGLFENARETMPTDETLSIEAKRAGKNAWVCIRHKDLTTKKEHLAGEQKTLLITQNNEKTGKVEPSIIYALVKEMGGKISCESDANYGIIITLYFPLA